MTAAQPILFRVLSEEGAPLVIPPPARNGTDWFFNLCVANEQWQFERTAEGEVIMIAPPGMESGDREGESFAQLRVWANRQGTGRAFTASVGFRLPNGALRFPDAAWVRRSRLAKVKQDEKQGFAPLCPDFVIEVLSPSDRLPRLQAKMVEYIENGARLGWLIDADRRKVHVYRPGKPVEILNRPMRLSGDPELPGFILKLAEIWNPNL
jgi:Uma2 family endonuclease